MTHEIKDINMRLRKVAYDRFAFVGLEIIDGDTRVVHAIRETTHSHVIETR